MAAAVSRKRALAPGRRVLPSLLEQSRAGPTDSPLLDRRGSSVGGTFIAPDSVKHIAGFLADHPEGVAPRDIPFKEIIGKCSEFVEVTGEVGDFVILHPFMLHASSQNVSEAAVYDEPPGCPEGTDGFESSRSCGFLSAGADDPALPRTRTIRFPADCPV